MYQFVSLSKMGKGSSLAAHGTFWLSPLPPILYHFFSHSSHIFVSVFADSFVILWKSIRVQWYKFKITYCGIGLPQFTIIFIVSSRATYNLKDFSDFLLAICKLMMTLLFEFPLFYSRAVREVNGVDQQQGNELFQSCNYPKHWFG